MKRTLISKALPLVLITVALVGCGGKGMHKELESLQEQVKSLKADGAKALSNSDEALTAANSAKRDAAQANNTAGDALKVANDAKSASADTDSKLDQMFKKAMFK